MKAITGIQVTDSQGRVIGKAKLQMTPDGADIHIELIDGLGMELVRSITDGFVDGLSLRPVIPPFQEASTVDR